jgi:hypothetical protein
MLRRADVAMYAAKTARKPFARYEPALDESFGHAALDGRTDNRPSARALAAW